jgi:LysR family transcriptional regulator of beta-lactamase
MHSSRPQLPLNALRAFEASARHRSFTRAAAELCVTQAAVSHQVKALEERLGVRLFHRGPRGLLLSDEGLALLPALTESFDRIGALLERFHEGRLKDVLTVSVVGTFAVGWLMPRLKSFRERHPHIDLRLLTNNNRINFTAEGLDAAILFGDGRWSGAAAERILSAPQTVVCAASAAGLLKHPADLATAVLLRSYRVQDWPAWFEATGLADPPQARGAVFDASLTMVQAAIQGEGVALAPPVMFARDLDEERLVLPFPDITIPGAYWLTAPSDRSPALAFQSFREWLLSEAKAA